MQVTVSCPECGTRFLLDDSKVSPQGCRATCSVCSTVFTVEPLPQDATATSPSGDRLAAPKPRPQPTGAGASPSRGLQPPYPPPRARTPPAEPPEVPDQVVHHGGREELLAMMLDAGRERREMASKMTRELFRLREVLREAVEQQQMVISRLVDTVSTRVPAPADTAQGEGNEELRARQEELIKKLLDAERGRLEMAREMTRELSGFREVVEQQQKDASRLVDTVSTQIPAPRDTAQAEGNEKLRARQEEFIRKLLDTERERLKMASEMTKELSGLREVVEQQQMVVSRLVDTVSTQIPAPRDTEQAERNEKLRARQEKLLAMMLDAERGRLDMASEMTKELSGLREVVEQQQMVVSRLVDTVSTPVPAPRDTEQAEGNERLRARQEELLETLLDAERERREMASEMTQELSGLREVVEQQQMVVSRLVDTVSTQIPAPLDTEQAEGNERLRARQEELLETLLDAERERCEMASEMTRELSGLREVVEQQQMVVSRLVDTVSTQIPAPLDVEQAERNENLLARQEELLAMMLDAERERREVASEMTKKLFGFREVVEQQQMVVSRLVDGVSTQIPAPLDTDLPDPANGDLSSTAPTEQAEGNEELLARQEDLEEELQRLKTALDREKDVVDRLRHGKLDLERRAAKAEATMEASDKPGILRRLLNRGGD